MFQKSVKKKGEEAYATVETKDQMATKPECDGIASIKTTQLFPTLVG